MFHQNIFIDCTIAFFAGYGAFSCVRDAYHRYKYWQS